MVDSEVQFLSNATSEDVLVSPTKWSNLEPQSDTTEPPDETQLESVLADESVMFDVIKTDPAGDVSDIAASGTKQTENSERELEGGKKIDGKSDKIFKNGILYIFVLLDFARLQIFVLWDLNMYN